MPGLILLRFSISKTCSVALNLIGGRALIVSAAWSNKTRGFREMVG